MPDTDLFDALLKPRLNGGATTGLFYQPIKETGDLITASRLRGTGAERLSELHIAPPSTKLGPLPTKILDDLNKRLVLTRAPSADEVVRLEIGELLSSFGGGNTAARNVLQAALEQKELTGALNASARKLNQSRLDPVERAMLSRSNIAMYAFFRAAIGMNVKDVDGITTNVLSSLDKVRSYVNRALVKEVLSRSNLQADPGEIKALQDRLAGRNLPYEGNTAAQTILAEYQHIKGNGELISAVNAFLDSGFVAVPDNVNRDVLVKEMIAYLGDNGFNPRAILGLDAAFRTTVNGLQVQFEDQSVDDGRVTSWLWDFGDGNASNMRNPIHTYGSADTFTVTLTVADDEGNEESVSRTVTVAQKQTKPKVEIEFQTSHLTVDFRARFTGGGKVVKWEWDFGDGYDSKADEPSHTFAEDGEYTVTLEVTDDAGTVASAERTISVARPPEQPEADFDADVDGLTVAFNDLSKGNIHTRSWVFGDGATSTATDPVHKYRKDGTYIVHLTVIGDQGRSDTKEQNLTLTCADGPNVVSGTVVGPAGRPIPGLHVRAHAGDAQLGTDVHTDEAGRFAIHYKDDNVKAGSKSGLTINVYDREGDELLESVTHDTMDNDLDVGTITIGLRKGKQGKKAAV